METVPLVALCVVLDDVFAETDDLSSGMGVYFKVLGVDAVFVIAEEVEVEGWAVLGRERLGLGIGSLEG